MVSIKKLESDCPLLKQNVSSEQPKCHLRGIRTHLYLFGTLAEENGFCGGGSCTAGNEQSLLDALLLGQWEDRFWKNRMRYDVTSCETKVISGEKKFIAQLNEKWDLNFLTEFEGKLFQPFGPFKSSYVRSHREDILLCVANGEKESSVLIPSGMLPKDGMLFLVNANPLEYGHVFLVPYNIHHLPVYFDKQSFELVMQVAMEINSCSFRIIYDQTASDSRHLYFQASYFAQALPVELLPTIPVYGCSLETGFHIFEVVDYPLKALVFMSKDNLKVPTEVVAELCSILQDQNTAFNLLISESGTKIFLFPQVKSVEGRLLSAWECAGYFVFKTRSEFECASEVEASKQLDSVSLNYDDFKALKQLCCGIANELVS